MDAGDYIVVGGGGHRPLGVGTVVGLADQMAHSICGRLWSGAPVV